VCPVRSSPFGLACYVLSFIVCPMYVYTCLYIYISVCVRACGCMCVCVCVCNNLYKHMGFGFYVIPFSDLLLKSLFLFLPNVLSSAIMF
jgi:hypothetical protein